MSVNLAQFKIIGEPYFETIASSHFDEYRDFHPPFYPNLSS